MDFSVLIPARLASSRLPNKPLADLAGRPMVVRVAERAALSRARQVVVAADSPSIVQACEQAGVHCVLTDPGHPSGSDRLAQACELLGLGPDEVVVNVQGDEPLIEPSLVDAVAQLLHQRPDCAMATAAHGIDSWADFQNPNVVKVVTDQQGTALYFSPGGKAATAHCPHCPHCPRRCATSASMPTASASCSCFPNSHKRPLKSSNRSSNCARSGTATASPSTPQRRPPARASTHRRILSGCAS
jgi:GTP:adenosylcobinamide-phosphate guanylyltransferase